MAKKEKYPTKVMGLLTKSFNLDKAAWAELIQARMDQLVKPNLDMIVLPQFGDHELVWRLNVASKVSLNIACEKLSDRDERCRHDLATSGIFATFAYPEPHARATRINGWGFNRKGTWLHFTLVATKRRLGQIVEQIIEVSLTEVELPLLLSLMEARYNPWRQHDNKPFVIWNRLGKLVEGWHAEREVQAQESRHFAELVQAENLVFSALHYV